MKKIRWNKAPPFIVGMALALLAVIAGFAMGRVVPATTAQSETFDGKKLYDVAFRSIRDYHLTLRKPAVREAFVKEWEHKFDGTDKLSTESSADQAVKDMLASRLLDSDPQNGDDPPGRRFDYFQNTAATQQEHDSEDSSLMGIGVRIEITGSQSIAKELGNQPTEEQLAAANRISAEHALRVVSTMEGGPAEGKLLPGDIITAVDGTPLNGKKFDDAMQMIRGATAGVTVDRTVGGIKKTLEVPVIRARLKLSVVHSKDLGDGIAYIKLDNFESHTTKPEFFRAVTTARNSGSKALIVDLRNNPGGEIGNALDIAAGFVPQGTLLFVHRRDGDHLDLYEVHATRDEIIEISGGERSVQKRGGLVTPENMPIVVLVNQNSASGSELVAGILQANHRALIIGKTTIGKGTGQFSIPLPFGRSMHVTNLEFLPGGRRSHSKGIIPDIDVDNVDRDSQLDRAITELKKQIGVSKPF